VSWDLYVFRGDLNADEEDWEPLDVHIAAEVFNSLEHTERDSDDEWWFTGPSGLDAMLGAYAGEDGVVRSASASVTFGPGDRDAKRADLRLVARALLEIAERTGARVGEPGKFLDTEDAVVAAGLGLEDSE
jgi:hypothetical protein